MANGGKRRRRVRSQTEPSASHSADYIHSTDHDTGDAAPRTLTVRVPLRLHTRGGRKVVLTPTGGIGWTPPQPAIDNALLKALARAHHWRRLLEGGEYASAAELANAEAINPSYLCRVLRLTLLAPAIVEAIFDGRTDPVLELKDLMRPFPMEWEQQRICFLRPSN